MSFCTTVQHSVQPLHPGCGSHLTFSEASHSLKCFRGNSLQDLSSLPSDARNTLRIVLASTDDTFSKLSARGDVFQIRTTVTREAMSTNRHPFLRESRAQDSSNTNCPHAVPLWVLQVFHSPPVKVTNVDWRDRQASNFINFVAAGLVGLKLSTSLPMSMRRTFPVAF